VVVQPSPSNRSLSQQALADLQALTIQQAVHRFEPSPEVLSGIVHR
jgi:hypothetical protein